MTVHRLKSLRFASGCAISSENDIISMLKNQFLQFQQGLSLNRGSRYKKSLMLVDENVSVNRSVNRSIKTTSNLTGLSAKRIAAEFGCI